MKNLEEDIYQDRSYSRCIKSAYSLFCDNFAIIFKKTWVPALALSLSCGVATAMEMAMTDAGDTLGGAIKTLVFILPVLLVGLVSVCLFYGFLISLLNGETRRHNVMRFIRQTLFMIGIGVVATAIIAGVGYWGFHIAVSNKIPTPQSAGIAIIAGFVMAVLLALFLLPTAYSTVKYLIEGKMKVLNILGCPYRKGMRYWGFLFIVMFITAIIASIVVLLVNMPMLIVSIANSMNSEGMQMGDPSGLPSYFIFLVFMTSAATSMFSAYLNVWVFFVLYYGYGSIEVRLKQKEQLVKVVK